MMQQKKSFSGWKLAFLLLLICIVIASGSFAYFFFASGRSTTQNPLSNIPPLATLSLTPPARGTLSLTPTAEGTLSLTPTAAETQSTPRHSCTLAQNGFESGIALPSWNTNPFGDDTTWRRELPQMKAQTSACWVEMPILFTQTGLHSTQVSIGGGANAVSSFADGVRFARSLGLHVFVSLLVAVNDAGSEHWVGKVTLTDYAQEQQWFSSYWQAVEPYVVAAAQAGADQLSVGTEIQWLEDHASATLWNSLIENMHSVFPGILTYDVNWTALQEPPPSWLGNSDLTLIGVSAYAPILSTSSHVDPSQIPGLWAVKVKKPLDAFAKELGKPIFVSEVGYRNSSDALYDPWNITSSKPADPPEQAAACAAVLSNTLPDQQIFGSFFWAWDGAEQLNLKNSPQAAAAIKSYYQSLSA
jgi:hypothetical protein